VLCVVDGVIFPSQRQHRVAKATLHISTATQGETPGPQSTIKLVATSAVFTCASVIFLYISKTPASRKTTAYSHMGCDVHRPSARWLGRLRRRCCGRIMAIDRAENLWSSYWIGADGKRI
jgi:hypothetical protein